MEKWKQVEFEPLLNEGHATRWWWWHKKCSCCRETVRRSVLF